MKSAMALPPVKKTAFLRILNYFSPNWKEVYRGPITRKLIYKGKVIGEEAGTQIIKVDRLNNIKYFMDEGDGYVYEFTPSEYHD